MTDATGEHPVLRVVRGDPTSAELAALVAVLVARAARAPDRTAPAPFVGGWSDRRHALRRPVPVGPGAWRASGRQPGLRTRAGW